MTTRTPPRNPAAFELVVAPGADGSFTLVEDDGTDGGAVVRTTHPLGSGAGELTVHPARRPGRRRAGERTWTVTFLGLGADEVPGAGGRRRAGRRWR